jgi:hypothetical protein
MSRLLVRIIRKGRVNMKSIDRVCVAAVVMVAIFALGVERRGGTFQPVPTVRADGRPDDDKGERCSATKLAGSYGFTTTGSIVAAGPIGLVADVGVLTFDGIGGVSQSETLSLNGAISERSSVGQYFVEPDCTGDMSLTLPPPAGVATSRFVIVDHGNELRFIVTGAGRVLTTNARKQ